MTNEEYEQWLPLIKKIAWKYRNNRYKLELDDLEQITAMGVMKAFDTYNEEKEMSLNTWIYNNAEWAIQRQFLYFNRIKNQLEYKTISLSTPIDDDLYLEDMIADDEDHIKEVEDRLIVESYKKEIDISIYNETNRNIIKSFLFTDLTLAQISDFYGLPYAKVRRIRNKGYETLREKSPMIRAKYLEYLDNREEKYLIDAYNNDPERIVMHYIQSENIKNKYKKEIEILQLLQNLFDYLNGYSYEDCTIKNFYLLRLINVLDKSDVEILDRYIFKREDVNVLVSEGYDYYEIFSIKGNIKSKIIKKKEEVYRLWRDYSERS